MRNFKNHRMIDHHILASKKYNYESLQTYNKIEGDREFFNSKSLSKINFMDFLSFLSYQN
jgi:hypothetical protein